MPFAQVMAPLAVLSGLPRLRLVDFREVHEEKNSCWSEAKCASMSHVASLAKTLKRRRPPGIVRFCAH